MSSVRGLEQENGRLGKLVLKVNQAGLGRWGEDEMVNPAWNK